LQAHYVTVVEDRPIMSIKYCLPLPVFNFRPKLAHPAARGRLKTRVWKTRHQTAGVENAGVAQYGKPKSPLFNIVTSVLQEPLELM